ncbi:torsin-4A isoform A [Alligator mississippiensis]|uniref:Torsin-4A isoform A n=1 Tax=Alligator mississippiensis TaxID=8496 RepID=A0A151MES5_ALLMI|nr:torsin-4A isoform A [Alligator mississippiensis]
MQLLWMPPVRPRRRRDVRRQSEWFREGSNMDGEPPCPKPPTLPHKISLVSSPMRAVIRLRRKVRIQKKNCLQVDLNKDKSPELVQTRLLQRQISLNRTNLCSSSISLFNQSSFENSRYFTFDTSRDQCTLNKYKRKKRRRKSKILNAIENLDDNLQKTNWTIQSQVIIILVAVQRCCTMTTERWETAGQLSPKTCPRLSQPCMGSVEPV